MRHERTRLILDASRTRTPGEGGWIAIALAVTALLVAADVSEGPLTGTYVLPPLMLAPVVRPRFAGAFGALCTVLAGLSSLWLHNFGTPGFWIRFVFVDAGGALAWYSAYRRCRAELEARSLTALAAVGDVVETSLIAVVAMDQRGRVTLFNAAAETMFGYSAREAVGAELASLIIPPEVRDAHRAGLRRYLETGEGGLLDRRVELQAMRADRTRIDVELTITRLRSGGETTFAGHVRDITDRRRAERTQRLLAKTAELVSSSLDSARTLREVARLAVPELADWCVVDLPTPDGRLEPVVIEHGDPEKVRVAREMRRRYPPAAGESTVLQVFRTGEPFVMSRIADETLAAAARDEEHLELLRTVGLGSLLIVPLRAGRRTIGTLTFLRADPERAFDPADLELAEELGRRAGIAVDNARLYEERSEVARTLQSSLKPAAIPAMPGWEAAALYRPAGRANEVGGDFYDVFPVPDGWMVVIGDVVGKGAPAAALTSLARYSIRTAATLSGSPSRALAHLNGDLEREGHNALLSAICVLVRETPDGARATIAAAGHPLPVLVHGGRPRMVGTPSLLLGVEADARFAETTIDMRADDRLVLYTDGVLDLTGGEERFGERRLVQALQEPAGSAQELVDTVDRALAAFGEGPQPDDIAMLVLRRLAPGARPALHAVPDADAAPGEDALRRAAGG